jgi:hypothetical protein
MNLGVLSTIGLQKSRGQGLYQLLFAEPLVDKIPTALLLRPGIESGNILSSLKAHYGRQGVHQLSSR